MKRTYDSGTIGGIQVDAYLVGGTQRRCARPRPTALATTHSLDWALAPTSSSSPIPCATPTYLTEWWDNKLTEGTASTVSVTNGAATTAKNAVLDRVSTISGTAMNNGTPVAGATVLLLAFNNGVQDPSSFETQTNASGAYSFTGLYPKSGAGGNYYKAYFPQPYGSTLTSQFYNQKTTLATAAELPLSEGTSLGGINFTWPVVSPGTLSGTVTASGGGALEGVTVSVSGGAAPPATTNVSGVYSIANLAPGTYTVTFSKALYSEVTITGVVVTAGGTTTRNQALTLIPSPGTLSGKVTATDTVTPLAGVAVKVDSLPAVSTNATGDYTVPGLAPGARSVTYTKAGYVEKTISVNIVAGDTVSPVVQLDKIPDPGTLSGVVKSGGSGLAGASVTVGSLAPVIADGSGAYTVSGIAPGTYSATYAKSGYYSQTVSVTINSGRDDPQGRDALQPLPAETLSNVYRFYNKKNGSHFYTASESEKNSVVAEPLGDLLATMVARTRVSSAYATPLYRFYNKKNGSHFYTAVRVREGQRLEEPLGDLLLRRRRPTTCLSGAGRRHRRRSTASTTRRTAATSTRRLSPRRPTSQKNLSATYALDGVAFYVTP